MQVTISKERYKKIEAYSRMVILWFTWLWMIGLVVLSYVTDISHSFSLLLIIVGFLPYLLIYNGYIRGVLLKRVEN